MTKQTWAVIILIIIILAGVWYYQKGDTTPVNTDTVKIGVIAPLTGWGAYWAEGYIKGVQLAVDEIKADGGKVEVVIEDGATDAQKSATAAQKLINIDKVQGLTAEFTAPASSVSPISAQSKIPFMYDAVTKSFLTSNPYAFKMYFDMDNQCYVATKQLALEGKKNIAIFSLNLDFAPECQSAAERVVKENNITITPYLFNVDTTDFRTILAKMKADKIDAIVPVFFEDHAIAFFKQKNDLRVNVPVFMGIGIPDGFTAKVRESVPAESIMGVRTYDQIVEESFKDKVTTKYPGTTEKDFISAAYGHDEIIYLYRALSNCPVADPDCVVKRIKKDDFRGALGSLGFGEDRVLNVTPVYYQFKDGKLEEFKPSI